MIRKPRRAAEHANQSSAGAATATRRFGCALLEDHIVKGDMWGVRQYIYIRGR